MPYGDASSLWIAIGKTRINLIIATASLLVPIIGLTLLHPQTPSQAAWFWGATALVLAPINMTLVLRRIRRSPLWLLGWLRPAAAATAAMALAVLAVTPALPSAPLLALACQASLGAAVFGLVAFLALGRRLPHALRIHSTPSDVTSATRTARPVGAV